MKYYEFKKIIISTVQQKLRCYLLLKILNNALCYVKKRQHTSEETGTGSAVA